MTFEARLCVRRRPHRWSLGSGPSSVPLATSRPRRERAAVCNPPRTALPRAFEARHPSKNVQRCGITLFFSPLRRRLPARNERCFGTLNVLSSSREIIHAGFAPLSFFPTSTTSAALICCWSYNVQANYPPLQQYLSPPTSGSRDFNSSARW